MTRRGGLHGAMQSAQEIGQQTLFEVETEGGSVMLVEPFWLAG